LGSGGGSLRGECCGSSSSLCRSWSLISFQICWDLQFSWSLLRRCRCAGWHGFVWKLGLV
jgi:hypothetical protein